MTPYRRRGTWVSVLEPALPGNITHLDFMYGCLIVCEAVCFLCRFSMSSKCIWICRLLWHKVDGFLEVFGWRIIWIGLECCVQVVFTESVTTVFVYWLLVCYNNNNASGTGRW